jgi:6-phosphogluconolactonase
MVTDKRTHLLRVTDSEQLAQQALAIFVESCQQSIERHQQFFTAISGGHTPELFYKKLSQPEVYSKLDWDKVHLFWVDERCVQPSGEASNFGLAARTFLQDVPIPPQNVHQVSGTEKAQTLKTVFSIEPDPVLYPVHALWPVLHKITWVIDKEAASLL